MIRPKLGIFKKHYLDSKNHYRYYSALYDKSMKNIPYNQRPKLPIWDLNTLTYIQTEKQLMCLIYQTFGAGEYKILAYRKKRKGLWVFWQGIINEEGFMCERRESTYRKTIDKLKEDLIKTNDDEEKQWIQDEIDLERECKEIQDYGIKGYLKPSITRGQMLLWDEPEITEKEKLEDWDENKEKIKDDWGLNNEKKEEFEDWSK